MARERILLFILTTTLTIVLGVITHYVALFVITLIVGLALIAPRVFGDEIGLARGRLRVSAGGATTDRYRLAASVRKATW